MSQPIEQAWTLKDTQARRDLPAFPKKGTAQQQEAWRKARRPLDDQLEAACGQHMSWLLTQGEDIWPDHTDQLEIPFLIALRTLKDNPDDVDAQMETGRHVARHLEMFTLSSSKLDGVDTQTIHDAIISHVSKGNFKHFLSDQQTCLTSGERIQMRVENWKMVAGRMMSSEDTNSWPMTFVPLEASDIQAVHTHTASIPVPSGQLLIAEWFNIPAFNAITKSVDDDEHFSALSSSQGRAERSQRYADGLGVVHVFEKRASIIQSKGAVTVGHLDPDAPEPKGLVGRINANLRWTTIVDREHLVALLADEMGHVDAQAAVTDYLAKNPDVIQVTVEPGTHHLYFAGDAHTFSTTAKDQFMIDGLYLEDFEEPIFALTEQPLQPANKPRRAPAP